MCAAQAAHSCRSTPWRQLHTVTGPLTISHIGQLPSATISFNLSPALRWARRSAPSTRLKAELKAPASLLGSFQGTAQAFQSSIGGMGVLLLLAVVTIYLVLGVLYESASIRSRFFPACQPPAWARW